MVVAAAPWATKRAGEGKDLVLPSAVMVVVVASTPSISCCVAWMWAVVRRSRHRPTHQSRPARREVPTALPPPARPLRQLPPQARVARSRCCWSRVLLHTSHHMRLVRRRDRSGVSPPMHPPPSGHPILRWPFPRHHCPSPWHGPLPRWQYVRPWVWCSSRRRCYSRRRRHHHRLEESRPSIRPPSPVGTPRSLHCLPYRLAAGAVPPWEAHLPPAAAHLTNHRRRLRPCGTPRPPPQRPRGQMTAAAEDPNYVSWARPRRCPSPCGRLHRDSSLPSLGDRRGGCREGRRLPCRWRARVCLHAGWVRTTSLHRIGEWHGGGVGGGRGFQRRQAVRLAAVNIARRRAACRRWYRLRPLAGRSCSQLPRQRRGRRR